MDKLLCDDCGRDFYRAHSHHESPQLCSLCLRAMWCVQARDSYLYADSIDKSAALSDYRKAREEFRMEVRQAYRDEKRRKREHPHWTEQLATTPPTGGG